MKTTLINQLLVRGATQRLDELNKEREHLIKLIEKHSTFKVPRFLSETKVSPKKGKSYKGKHWTQRPENRAKMLKNLKRAHREKVASNG